MACGDFGIESVPGSYTHSGYRPNDRTYLSIAIRTGAFRSGTHQTHCGPLQTDYEPLVNFGQRFRTGVACRILGRWTAVQRAHIAVEHGIVRKLVPIDRLKLVRAALTPILLQCAHPRPIASLENPTTGGAGKPPRNSQQEPLGSDRNPPAISSLSQT